jgi:hypothetical protein
MTPRNELGLVFAKDNRKLFPGLVGFSIALLRALFLVHASSELAEDDGSHIHCSFLNKIILVPITPMKFLSG